MQLTALLKNVTILALGLGLISCHPLSIFNPKSLPSHGMKKSINHSKDTVVAIDHFNIPFIKAQSIDDAIFALGFMHARDRLFQLDMIRHASLGRLSELFKEKALALDQRLRILTYRLDEQLERLDHDERHLISTYVKGVNHGAKMRGKTAEHFLLGIEFEEFHEREVIAIARLQSWMLASDLHAEIARLAVARSDLSVEAKRELWAAVDDRGSAIINRASVHGAIEQLSLPSYIDSVKAHPVADRLLMNDNGPTMGPGASNAWVISAKISDDKQAILMNDPHLEHTWPSNFYLATLATGDLFVAGATFVGLPGILIGSSKKLSWGITASYVNTQDSVVLKMDSDKDQHYLVDQRSLELKRWPQRFCLGKTNDCIEKMFYDSIFGPVIHHEIDPNIDPKDHLAIQWTGFDADMHQRFCRGFLELSQAVEVDHGLSIIRSMTLPGVNVVLADGSGNIGYGYAGLIPVRDDRQNPYLPLDGSRSRSLWPGYLGIDEKPSAKNPASGFIVTANQNVFNRGAKRSLDFGKQGASPYRALRIRESIEEELANQHHLDFSSLSNIQMDATSIEARELAPLLGKRCQMALKDQGKSAQEFYRQINNFDGVYGVNSRAALPYDILMGEILRERFNKIFSGQTFSSRRYLNQISYAVKNALLAEMKGKPSAIFADLREDGEGLDDFLQLACSRAWQRIGHEVGQQPFKWRWGRHHYLLRQSPLAKAPIIGGLFRDKKREVSGTYGSPMAEGGRPVRHGANLRLRVKMSQPPLIEVILDSGNSGNIGDDSFDQAAMWHDGEVITLKTHFQQSLDDAKKIYSLKPMTDSSWR